MESILPENHPAVRRKRRVKRVRKAVKRSRLRWYEACGLIALALGLFAGYLHFTEDIAYRAELKRVMNGVRHSAPMEALSRFVDPDKLRRTK